MPQFLTTAGTSHIIEDIIIKAKSELVLITPYLKLSRILFERLTDANHRGVRIQLVYGKSELQPSERQQLNALTNIELLFLSNLHAKCYFNESTLIVSSMNLYEFSEKNNREMGIVLTRRDDVDCFADALAEAHSIINAARGGTPRISSLSVPLVASPPTATQIPSVPKVKREVDQALMVQRVFEMLQQLPDTRAQFSIETTPLSGRDGKSFSTISATKYPRSGVNFSFAGACRFDFSKSEDYQAVASTQRTEIERLLGSSYRCFWNKTAVSIYAAQNYEQIDEATTAAYFLKAIKCVAGVLKGFPLPVRTGFTS
jgi:hypothetical protein